MIGIVKELSKQKGVVGEKTIRLLSQDGMFHIPISVLKPYCSNKCAAGVTKDEASKKVGCGDQEWYGTCANKLPRISCNINQETRKGDQVGALGLSHLVCICARMIGFYKEGDNVSRWNTGV